MVKKVQAEKSLTPKIGLTSAGMNGMEDSLNKLLSSEFVLLVQILNYHWNLTGIEFNDYHKLFNDHYQQTFENIDLIAERVRALGGTAAGTMKEFIKHSALNEDAEKSIPPKKMVERLLNSNELVIKQLRDSLNKSNKINDHGTANMLGNLIEQREKTAWILRSLLGS